MPDLKILSLNSEEKGISARSISDMSNAHGEQLIPSPVRRHHLKFGVLGKRNEGKAKRDKHC